MAISLAYPSGEEWGYFTCSNDFYLPSLRLLKGGRGVNTLGLQVADNLTFSYTEIEHEQILEILVGLVPGYISISTSLYRLLIAEGHNLSSTAKGDQTKDHKGPL